MRHALDVVAVAAEFLKADVDLPWAILDGRSVAVIVPLRPLGVLTTVRVMDHDAVQLDQQL